MHRPQMDSGFAHKAHSEEEADPSFLSYSREMHTHTELEDIFSLAKLGLGYELANAIRRGFGCNG